MLGKDVDELIPRRWVVGIVGAAAACVVAMAVASTLLGCTGAVNTRVDFPMERAAVGLIDTSSTSDVSRIAFYDENLNELGEMPFDRGGMGDGWADACVEGDALYVAPLGIDKFEPGPTDEVLQISLREVAVRPFAMGEDHTRLNCVAASDRSVFAASSGGAGYVARCDKQSGEVKTLPLPDETVTALLWTGRSLFAFCTNDGVGADTDLDGPVPAAISRALQLDENLNVEREYDLTAYGSDVRRVVACDGVLYAVCSAMPDGATGHGSAGATGASGAAAGGGDQSEPSNIVMVNTDTGEVTFCPLPVTDALAVAVHDGRLLMVRQDMVAPTGNAQLSVGNMDGGDLETYELTHLADQMALRGDRLYLADAGARTVYAYDLGALGASADNPLTPVASAELAATDGAHTYITNLFAVGKEPNGAR